MYYRTNISTFITFLLPPPNIYSSQAITHTEKLPSTMGISLVMTYRFQAKINLLSCAVCKLNVESFQYSSWFCPKNTNDTSESHYSSSQNFAQNQLCFEAMLLFQFGVFVDSFISCYRIKGFILIFKNVVCVWGRG